MQGIPVVRPSETLGDFRDVLERAVTSGFSRPSTEAARALLGKLEEECAEGGEVPPEAILTVSIYCARLASATLDGSWLDAVFRIHHARSAVLPVELVDVLYVILRRVRINFPTFSGYLHAISERRSELTPSERFALRRTEGLVALLR